MQEIMGLFEKYTKTLREVKALKRHCDVLLACLKSYTKQVSHQREKMDEYALSDEYDVQSDEAVALVNEYAKLVKLEDEARTQYENQIQLLVAAIENRGTYADSLAEYAIRRV
jgi:hypothetical protein